MSLPTPTGDLQAQLRTLRDRLCEDLALVSPLRAVAARRGDVDRLLADLEHQLTRVRQAAVITLVGPTGAGKSTMLNALVGRAIAEEGIDRPTTRRPVIYAPRDADLGDLLEGIAEIHPSDGVAVVRYDPAVEAPWTAQILIDAPDLNSVAEDHRAVVTALAERSDVLVVVLHRQAVVEEASVSFLDAFAGRRHLLFALNRADELTPAARDEILEQVRDLAVSRWNAAGAPVLAVSARAAQVQPRAEGWAELCQTLYAMVRESAIGGVRRLNALGTAARLQEIFAAIVAAVSEDLGLLPDEVDAGEEQLAECAGEEVSSRLSLRRTDLNALLWAEAAKRWDGPGGWALRAGGIGSLGVGAGALLLRRSPLVAAGTAAGSIAADQVQRAGRQRRIEDPAGLLPGPSEFEALYSAALSPSRVRAARLAGDPEALGIPPADETRSRLAAAVEEAWLALVERDLPAAAEHSVLRFFRLLLDLPVYALAAWVVYQVAIGFFAGRYAGIDFIVNALLLLAAYLFPVRVVVRRALSRRARRLLEEVTTRTREALRAQADTTNAAVRDVAARYVETLGRLSSLEKTWRTALGADP